MTADPPATRRIGFASILVLVLACGLTTTDTFALGAFIAAISDDLDISVPLLGQVTTAAFLLSAGFSLFSGPLADHIGQRRVILMGLATLVLSAAGTMLAPTYGWVLLITLLAGETPAGQGTTMALNGAVFSLGSALGGAFGGGLLALGGYPALAVGLTGFAFAATALVWLPSTAMLSRRRVQPAETQGGAMP